MRCYLTRIIGHKRARILNQRSIVCNQKQQPQQSMRPSLIPDWHALTQVKPHQQFKIGNSVWYRDGTKLKKCTVKMVVGDSKDWLYDVEVPGTGKIRVSQTKLDPC